MNIYEAMATQRAVRRLRPILFQGLSSSVFSSCSLSNRWECTAFSNGSGYGSKKLAAMGALYSKQWDSYTSGMRAEGEQLALPRRKMMEAGDYLCEHFHTLPLVVVFCFNANHMAITDADLDRPRLWEAVRFTRPSRTSCWRRGRKE